MTEKASACHNRVSKYLAKNSYDRIRNELTYASSGRLIKNNVTDIVLKSSREKLLSGAVTEKFTVRYLDGDKNRVFLIKECSKGNRIKEIIEPISHETSQRILERSIKWLCASPSPLIHELGVKMTTDRIVPETIIRFDRDLFELGKKLNVTADSGISLSEYGNFEENTPGFDAVDTDTCLLQVNYERIIPENILSIIGLKHQH